MKLKADREAVNRFVQVSRAWVRGEQRRYYVTRADDPALALLVCRGGLSLEELVGQVVDANVGWERGVLGFALEPDVGRRHTKITIYRRLHGQHEKTLSEVLQDAPRRER